jgi:four helix bundle protein
MATWKRFEDIDAWKKARALSKEIHVLTADGKCSRDYAFVKQFRSAALSIMSNIAEGFERDGNREFASFVSIAKGSAGEVRSQLYSALDVGYCSEADFDRLYGMATEISRMLGGLLNYLCNTEVRGLKFKDPASGPADRTLNLKLET